ncbi:Methylthioribose-1-phosphate isomerase, partial [hydrothermal vent metagenome]
MSDFVSLNFENQKLTFIDQTKLPLKEEYVTTDNYERIAEAIERLEIRGAPAIGVAAAYALALSLKDRSDNPDEKFITAYERLARTRPTAVNLFWALDLMKSVFQSHKNQSTVFSALVNEAEQIHQDDIDKCEAIANNGVELLKDNSTILTHCNTGQLATGGKGTAFNVIKKGYELGKVKFVYADETRPLLQGSRLTAFELSKAGIPFKLLVDSAAASLFKQNKINAVIVGADRIAANGDTANKIGTFNLAVLCHHFNVPFYIAAPVTTIDTSIASGDDINIEMRDKTELSVIRGVQVTNPDYDAYTPAFDVTPNELIAAIITDEKNHKPPYSF